MKDRIPTYAGRVVLTPVSGNIYDMTMADEPTEVGTPLNKANLLTDATAAAIASEFGITPDTPNEALAAITAGSGKTELQSYVGTGTYGSSYKNTLTFAHEPKLVLILGHEQGGSHEIAGAGMTDTALLSWDNIKTASQANFRNLAPNTMSYMNAYTLSNDNKTITWYNTQNAQNQLNTQSCTYFVVSFY